VGESGEKGSFGIKKDIFGYLKYPILKSHSK
jgi:hypothetical protein